MACRLHPASLPTAGGVTSPAVAPNRTNRHVRELARRVHEARRMFVRSRTMVLVAMLAACGTSDPTASEQGDLDFGGGTATVGAALADPGAMWAGGQVHIYGTGRGVGYVTTDPAHPFDLSTTIGEPSQQTLAASPSTLDGAVWAPSVREVNGTYVMWYSGHVKQANLAPGQDEPMCLWRATHGSPGPGFVNVSDQPICGPDGASFTIAPDLEILPSGPVLYVKTLGKLMVHKLDATATNLDPSEPWRTVVVPSAPWELGDQQPAELVEGPALVHLSGGNPVHSRWFVFYSGNAWRTRHYALGYADCGNGPEPAYPCTKITDDGLGPWLRTSNAGGPHGPGAGSFFRANGNDYLVVAGWKYACDSPQDDCEAKGTCGNKDESCLYENDGANDADHITGRRLYMYHVWLGSDVTGDGVGDPHFNAL